MSERDISQEILEGIREIKAHKAGKIELKTCELGATPMTDVGEKLKGPSGMSL